MELVRFLSNHILAVSLLFITAFPVMQSLADDFYYSEKGGVKHYTNVKPSKKGFTRISSGWTENPYTESIPARALRSTEYSDRYDDYIVYASRRYGLDPDLIKAIIKVESDFYHRAVSPKGAMGVMQLMPGTADKLGVRRPFDPSDNISGGSKYLRKLLDMFNGNKTLALAGYNAGENAVIRYGYSIPPYRETQRYVKKVFAHYNRIKHSSDSLDRTSVTKSTDPAGSANSKESGKRQVSKVSYQESLTPDGKFVRKTKKSKVIVESVKYIDVEGSPKPKKTYSKKADTGGDYTVQIASFSEIDSARELESSLKSETLPAYIKVARIPGKGTWYRVRVGGFRSKSEAVSYAEYLKSRQPLVNGAFVTAN